jgi:hypothetical protein
MPDVNLELAEAIELAELLTFLAEWLSGSQRQTLTDSLTAFVGHPAYDAPPTYTASSSCSASTTANNSSENPHHDQHNQ